MSEALKRRVERLEEDWHLRRRPPLMVLVEKGENVEEAIERGRARWGRPMDDFSMTWILDMHGRGGVSLECR